MGEREREKERGEREREGGRKRGRERESFFEIDRKAIFLVVTFFTSTNKKESFKKYSSFGIFYLNTKMSKPGNGMH